MFSILINPLLETLYMVLSSAIIALLIGFPIGVLIYISEKDSLWENKIINNSLSTIVNIGRSFPFIILMIVLSPLSRYVIGTSIGTSASIVPLSIAAAPFIARIVESSLKEVSHGIIEASLSMGATNLQIILRVLIPEALPSLILGMTLTLINLIGYSAMAGAIGGGGLGDLAIRYGFYRFQSDIMILSVVVIILLVQGIQVLGNKIAFNLLKNR
ncbi:ABC transporter permease [Clostridium sp. D2Q-11]|uniref:ABC transporter permease n=1 Tax=Anaeromonas frigoriresistens TaxID=2683708 RepID=A0A942UV48_9FIRM|nr:methionine ABC transporter permease [Anaeromonas frigoriresistens]MBS4537446.1 ABC transporter permease [Anaeromonas frigoriresistens]